MCGRFTQMYSWEQVREFLDLLGPPQNLRPRYSVAPSENVAVVRLGSADDQSQFGFRLIDPQDPGLGAFFTSKWQKR